jgi:predicted DNA-binding transcriptional regulator YafY
MTARQAGCSVRPPSALQLVMKKAKSRRKKKEPTVSMIPNILQLLTSAIREKRCVAIRYHDQRHVRVIEPHVIYTHETGELVVEGYQTRGYSSSGRPPPFWRPFRLKKISAVSLLKETFETRVREGFAYEKDKYRNGLVAMIDDRRRAGGLPPQAMAARAAANKPAYSYPQPEETGPHMPKNPFRR